MPRPRTPQTKTRQRRVPTPAAIPSPEPRRSSTSPISPPTIPAVYKMLQEADTVGIFQVESRAQMATLPRLRPQRFYDIVVEVAIIRPGPIVGQMVHPYLKRRQGVEPVTYPHPSLEPILARTLGVPLFQEQLLRMAMVAAGFTGGEAEELRRAFGFKRSEKRMQQIEGKLRAGIERQGITGEAAEEIIRSITSFALYGFPESHAASFALLVYASAYLKVHYPAAFFTAMLNNQPMGFYHPATLVKDAQRHGVRFAPIDVQVSDWECRVEPDGRVRLGLMYVNGLRQATGRAIAAGPQDRGGACARSGSGSAGRVRSRSDARSAAVTMSRCWRRRRSRRGSATSARTSGDVRMRMLSAGQMRRPIVILRTTARGMARSKRSSPQAASGATNWRPSPKSERSTLYPALRGRPPSPQRAVADRAGRASVRGVVQGRARDRPTDDRTPTVDSGRRLPTRLPTATADRRLRDCDCRRDCPTGDSPTADPGLRLPTATADRRPPTVDCRGPLRPMTAPERLLADYAGTSLTIGPHPMALRRAELALRGVLRARDLPQGRQGRRVRVAGAVITRQRPGTAKGFVFLTLEDETGIANIIVRPDLFTEQRAAIIGAPYLLIEGTLQLQEGVTSIKAERVIPLTGDSPEPQSHDFR